MALTMPTWFEMVTQARSPESVWAEIHGWLLEQALSAPNGTTLHAATVPVDRLLAEAAWELWVAYSSLSTRTAHVLKHWWDENVHAGRAVLILDALSLRELRLVLQGAEQRGIKPARVAITAAEVPTDTDNFAEALGVPGRASLRNNGAPSGFILHSANIYTDVLQAPFDHCLEDVKPAKDLVLWHQWLDDLVHLYKRTPAGVASVTEKELLGDGFWLLVNKMRQGRRLVITSDHGYAVSELFSTEEEDQAAKTLLQKRFGQARSCKADEPLPQPFLGPLAITANGHHVVIGQRRWKVQNGFPHVCHRGLTLLEASVPFIEFPEV